MSNLCDEWKLKGYQKMLSILSGNRWNTKYQPKYVNEKGEVKVEQYTTKPETLDFLNLTASTYYIRVVHDTNGNGKYDTGNYLKKIQPERVSHFKEVEVRADWGYPETLEFTSE